MIKSMTGFGHAEMANDSCRITVEMKSVNNRYLDISIRMPRQLNALEGEIKKELKRRFDATLRLLDDEQTMENPKGTFRYLLND